AGRPRRGARRAFEPDDRHRDERDLSSIRPMSAPPPSSRPLVVGIAGGTGSGKTTVAHKLAASMPGRCVTLEHDAYYIDQGHLPPEQRAIINYDHPASLESSLLAEHLRELRAGRGVDVPSYD